MTTRRSALLTLTAIIGALTNKLLDAQSTGSPIAWRTAMEPTTLKFELRAFKQYQITLDGKPVVTLTPGQMADALREK